MLVFRDGRGQQAQLHLAGHGKIALQLLLMANDLAVESGVFDGDCDLRGQCGQGALVALVEVARADMLQIEDANDAVFVEERHDHLRARFGIDHVIAGVLADIGDVDQPPLGDGSPYQAGVDRQRPAGHARVAEAPGIARHQLISSGVDQHEGEHLVVDQAAQKLADALEELVEVEDRGQLNGDLVEHFERLRLPGDARVEACVLDGLADARGGHGKQVQVLWAEVVYLVAFEIEHADDFVLVDQRHGKLGAHLFTGRNVVLDSRVRLVVHVVDQDGLAR